jgi:hypothetical protein
MVDTMKVAGYHEIEANGREAKKCDLCLSLLMKVDVGE